ncbi:Cerato-platanin [Schizophyllum amplum]|uniref:Cerato-platanin n=1 Tax=Schizophyllum amplum TaxID=97359 RepID=A0A550CSC2_9AGAR|nr:Cerato-platanin [Auriculariopsis ampla]
MKFTSILIAAAAAISSVCATTVRYDPVYDNASQSLTTVSCSDGEYGLITRGYSTFGSLPEFPHIGAVEGASHGTATCGTCYKVSWTDEFGTTRSIHVLAVDYATSGFNIAETALDELTGGRAAEKGTIDATTKQVNVKHCGL